MAIEIITDSTSDLTAQEAREILGIKRNCLKDG